MSELKRYNRGFGKAFWLEQANSDGELVFYADVANMEAQLLSENEKNKKELAIAYADINNLTTTKKSLQNQLNAQIKKNNPRPLLRLWVIALSLLINIGLIGFILGSA